MTSNFKRGRPGPDSHFVKGIYCLIEIMRLNENISLMTAFKELGERFNPPLPSHQIKHLYYDSKKDIEGMFSGQPISHALNEILPLISINQGLDRDYSGKTYCLFTEKLATLKLPSRKKYSSVNSSLPVVGKTLSEAFTILGIALREVSPGQHYTICPNCNSSRKERNKKRKCLAVKIDPLGQSAVCRCHNCPWTRGIKAGDRG
jgi:hypothetical protein